MSNAFDAVTAKVARYYADKLAEHGPTPRGVDWNSAESHEERFRQLATVIDCTKYSVIDYGCGYGALLGYLRALGHEPTYAGFDLAEAMTDEARRQVDDARAVFTNDRAQLSPADFVLASGIFNVKLLTPDDTWIAYILATLDDIASLAVRGFAFNVLTGYADEDRKRSDLHYADPGFLFDHCVRRYSRHVALLHDYGLYEFTIRVRLEP